MTAACEMMHSVSTLRADSRSYHGDDSVDIDAGHDAVQATRALFNPLVQVAIQPSA
jgi:hypothetical protein